VLTKTRSCLGREGGREEEDLRIKIPIIIREGSSYPISLISSLPPHLPTSAAAVVAAVAVAAAAEVVLLLLLLPLLLPLCLARVHCLARPGSLLVGWRTRLRRREGGREGGRGGREEKRENTMSILLMELWS